MKTKSLKLMDLMTDDTLPAMAILREVFGRKTKIDPWVAYFKIRSYIFWKRVFATIYALIFTSATLFIWLMPHEVWRVIIIVGILIIISLILRDNAGHSQKRNYWEIIWNEFREMKEALAQPLLNHYQGPLYYSGKAVWEAFHKELVSRAKDVLFAEKHGSPTGFPENVLVAIKSARERFSRFHSVALKYHLAEEKWDVYFDVARAELEKESSK